MSIFGSTHRGDLSSRRTGSAAVPKDPVDEKEMREMILETPYEMALGVAKRFRAIRKEKRIMLKEVSEKSGVPYSTLRRFESKGEISFLAFVKITSAIGEDRAISDLFTDHISGSIEEGHPWKSSISLTLFIPECISGFSISPFSLSLTPGVKIAKMDPFNGLFGVFADSLPDGWNRLLVDRMLRKRGEKPEEISSLQRLSIVGSAGMGALEYRPACQWERVEAVQDLDRLASECP